MRTGEDKSDIEGIVTCVAGRSMLIFLLFQFLAGQVQCRLQQRQEQPAWCIEWCLMPEVPSLQAIFDYGGILNRSVDCRMH